MSIPKELRAWFMNPPSDWRLHALCTVITTLMVAGELLIRQGMELMHLVTDHYMIWCVTPVTLLMFLAWGYRVWPGVLAGGLLGCLPWFSPLVSLAGALDGVVQIALGTWLIRLLWPKTLPMVPSVRFFSVALGLGVLFPVFFVSLPTVLVFSKAIPFADSYWGGYLEWCVSEMAGTIVLLPALLMLFYPSFRRTVRRPLQLIPTALVVVFLLVVFTIRDLDTGIASIMSAEAWVMIGTVSFLMVIRNGVGGIILANLALAATSIALQIYLAGKHSPPLSPDTLVQFNVLVCHLMGLTLIVAAGFYDYQVLCQVLRETTGKMLNAQVSERRRLASELHDSVSQEFAAALLRLRMALSPKAQAPQGDNLQSAEASLVNGLHDLRRILSGLRPELLEQSRLADIITSYCEEIEARYGVDILITDDCPLTDPAMPPETREHLFRILQEAVNNAITHGKAKTLLVSVRTDPDKHLLSIEIEDDGVGFDPLIIHQLTDRPHLGLRIMHERARTIGGTLHIKSSPQGKTTISLQVPLDRKQETPPSASENLFAI